MNIDLDTRKKILIVDDDPFMQSLYRKALEREGFSILTALDGLAAVEMLPTLTVDMIVLDLMLPKVHGLKVLEAVRTDKVHKNLPVLILSNAYLPDVAQKAMNAKATTGILKSECSPKKLVKIIRDIFNAPPVPGDKAPAGQGSWLSGLLRGKDQNSSPAAPGAKTAEATIAETATLSEVQSELGKSWPTDVSLIREDCLKYVKTVGSQESEEHLKSVYRQLRLLSARATMGEWLKVSQLCNALEAMLFEHGFNLKRSMSPSVVQTMVQAVDCIEHLFRSGDQQIIQSSRKTRVLLVDDDAVCNMVNDIALKRANFDTVCVADGVAALALLENNPFDLIFLDVNMPVLSGFEVCEKLRKLPRSKDTPVIFVTLYGDFQSRAQGVLSGSNGFIAKPISPLELIVKALVFLQRSNPNEKPAVGRSAQLAAQVSAPAASLAMASSDKAVATVAVAGEEGRVKELQATKAAVDDKVKALTEALAQESKRREEAEQQAATNAKVQSKLEAAQAENQKAYEWLQRLMEESEKQSQNGDTSQAWKADGRTRALEAVRSFVEDKVKNLTKVLAVETEKSELARQKAAEFTNRRSELEAALAAVEQAKENLLRDIEAAGSGEQRGKLEAALAENQKSQSALFQKLVEAQQEFQIHQQNQAFEQGQAGIPGQTPTGEPTDLAALKSELASATAQIQTLTALLAEEAERRATAENKAAELAENRTKLEKELAERLQTQEQLRAELAESHQRLDAQVQTHTTEVGNFTGRMKEFESAQAALEELRNQHASVTGQVQSLTESLAAEAGRRTTAEEKTAELTARRAELEQELAQRSQAQEQLRAELAEKEQRLQAQVQGHTVELGHLSERAKELETAQAALVELKNQHAGVTTEVQSLKESLNAEAGRRTTAEAKAAELTARRTELEQELAQGSQAQEQLRAELAEKEQRLQAQVQAHSAEANHFTDRVKEFESAQAALAELRNQHASVTSQAQSLTESLAAEAGRRTTAEQTAAELAARKSELEQELAQRSQAQEQLRTELAEKEQRLQAQMQTHTVEFGHLAERTKELETAQAELTELKSQHASVTTQVQSLTEALTAEAGRRTSAEQTTAELTARRQELERELAEHSQAHEQLNGQLAGHQQRLEAQIQKHNVERGNLDARTKELKATQAELGKLKRQHAEVTTQVKSLTESLASEAGRRTTAEQTAAELTARRNELEQELAQRSQTHEQLNARIASQQQRLDEQVQAQQVESGKLAERTKESAAAQAAIAELKNQQAEVTAQVASLTESLAAEAGRRTTVEQTAAELTARRNELEQELAQRSQTHEQLNARIASQQQRFEEQVQAQQVESGKLAERTKESAAAQAVIAELKSQQAEVTAQVASLTESLATEAGRRTTAEQTAAELTARKNELEQELAQRSQTHEQLHAQLAEQQRRLEAQTAAYQAEAGNLTARSQELEATQAVLAALKSQHANVTAQMESLTYSLAVESERRTTAEQTARELAARRAELEQELNQRSKTHEELHAQLAGQQERFEAQVQAHRAETDNLAERTKELATAQGALEELKNRHTQVTTQAQALTESLAVEAGRRTHAEEKAVELTVHRTQLEQELAQRTQAQEQLRGELAEQQKRYEAQVQAHTVETNNLDARTKELAKAQGALAKLKSEQAKVAAQVKSLRGSLASETNRRSVAEAKTVELAARRNELEQELTQRSKNQDTLRAELAGQQQRLEAQTQAQAVETGNLAARTKELELAQAALVELKNEQAKVVAQVASLMGSLAAENDRRSTAEAKAAELATRRNELEQELAQRSKNQDELRAELAEQRQRLETQAQAQAVETGNLAARTKELELAQAALVELKSEYAQVTAQVASLTESLAAEAGRRTNAESTAAELTARRAELEQELTRGAQTQEGLRSELAAKKQEVAVAATELEDFRTQATASAALEKKMAGQMAESEQARAELGRQLSAANELASTREATLRTLEEERQQRRAEQERLEARLEAELAQHRQLEAQKEAIQHQLNDLSGQLARKTAAEQAWLGRESELLNRLRTQQDEIAKAGASLAAREEEGKRSSEQLEEMRVAQSALCVQVQEITEQARKLNESLVTEVDRRLQGEQTVAGLEARRAQLEQELDGSSQAQAALRSELDAQLQNYNLETGRLAERTRELETAQATLAELKHQQASLAGQVQTLTESLATESGRHAAAEQAWTGRESEWQSRLNALQDQIAKATTTLTSREEEINNAREKISELQILQSALCAKVQVLTRQADSTAKVVQEWQTKAARSEDATAKVQRKLAGLHYSILDASRLSARLQRERLQREHQNLAAMQQLLASLAETPLSLTQRGVLAELQHSTENLKGNRAGATRIEAFRVELPDLRDSHFGFAEVAESAFRAIRAAAANAGVAAQVTAAGITTGKLIGFAEHIQQLIILLATAPFGMMKGIAALDLRLELVPENSIFSKMTVRVGLSADNQAQALLAHINTVAASSATLQSGEFSEAEFGLAAGWQLAAAMGAQTNAEAVSSHEVRLLVSMLIEMDRGPVAAHNGHSNGNNNGNGNGSGNGNGNGHDHAIHNGSRGASHNGHNGHDADHSSGGERQGLQPTLLT